MGPSQSQLRFLPPEDRNIYKKWLRRSVIFYGTALVLLVLAVAANHLLTPTSPDLAGDIHTAAIATRK